jgi:hypothetical protein
MCIAPARACPTQPGTAERARRHARMRATRSPATVMLSLPYGATSASSSRPASRTHSIRHEGAFQLMSSIRCGQTTQSHGRSERYPDLRIDLGPTRAQSGASGGQEGLPSESNRQSGPPRPGVSDDRACVGSQSGSQTEQIRPHRDTRRYTPQHCSDRETPHWWTPSDARSRSTDQKVGPDERGIPAVPDELTVRFV